MIRLMGALFIAAGSAWLGFGAAGRLGARTRTLEELAEGLSRMARELELDQPPLEQLLERLIPGSRGAARTLFAGCRTALDHLEEEPFARAWERLVESEPLLNKEGQACLLPLGQVLGRPAPGAGGRAGQGGAASDGPGLSGAGAVRRGVSGDSPAVRQQAECERG